MFTGRFNTFIHVDADGKLPGSSMKSTVGCIEKPNTGSDVNPVQNRSMSGNEMLRLPAKIILL